MNIIAYINSLLPSFSKNRVVDDARETYAELLSNTVPAYIEAEKVFNNYSFRSQVMKDFSVTYKRIVREDKQVNMIVSISRALERIGQSKDYIQDKIDSNFESEVVSDGMSSVKANLLRILEAVGFTSDYAMLFLNYVYILETGEIVKDTGYVKSTLSPAEIQYLNKHFSDFCLALNTIAKDKQKIVKAIDEIPDVLLNINTGATLIGTVGEDKLDPLLLRNFTSDIKNPIYHLRMIFAERQVQKYKRNRELKKVLELRLLNMTMQLEGAPDAKLEKEIQYVQGRVQSLDHDLKKMEEGI